MYWLHCYWLFGVNDIYNKRLVHGSKYELNISLCQARIEIWGNRCSAFCNCVQNTWISLKQYNMQILLFLIKTQLRKLFIISTTITLYLCVTRSKMWQKLKRQVKTFQIKIIVTFTVRFRCQRNTSSFPVRIISLSWPGRRLTVDSRMGCPRFYHSLTPL